MLDSDLYYFLERLCLHQFKLPSASNGKAFVTKPFPTWQGNFKTRSFHENELIGDAPLVEMVSLFNLTGESAFLFSL